MHNQKNSRESKKKNKSENIRRDPYLGLTGKGRDKKIVEKELNSRMVFST